MISSDRFNRSRIGTVLVAAVTTSERVAEAPGNVRLVAGQAGLDRDCAVNVTQLVGLDRRLLDPPVGHLDALTQRRLDDGLRLVLDLP